MTTDISLERTTSWQKTRIMHSAKEDEFNIVEKSPYGPSNPIPKGLETL